MRPARSERVPLAQYATTGAFLSGSFSSTWISRKPRGSGMAPGIAPWRISSFSRTSRRTGTSPASSRRFRSSTDVSGTSFRASSSICLYVLAMSALGTVEEVHAVLEPARHAAGVARGHEQAQRAQYAPHGIPTREGQRIPREPEKVAELVCVRAAEESAAPERDEDHAALGGSPAAARSSRTFERAMRTAFVSMKSVRS